MEITSFLSNPIIIITKTLITSFEIISTINSINPEKLHTKTWLHTKSIKKNPNSPPIKTNYEPNPSIINLGTKNRILRKNVKYVTWKWTKMLKHKSKIIIGFKFSSSWLNNTNKKKIIR